MAEPSRPGRRLVALGLLAVGIGAAAAGIRVLDPRPRNDRLRARLITAAAGLDLPDLATMGGDGACATFLAACLETATALASAALADLSDPTVRDFAQRVATTSDTRVAALRQTGASAGPDPFYEAIRTRTRADLGTAIAIKTLPDRIFVFSLQAVYGGAVAAAGHATESASAPALIEAAEEVLLVKKSAIASMTRWLTFNGHH
ncbi:hypothetical protein SAMN04487972_12339 [Paracoccus halophilus]|uniref:Uncharacterized protein n=1 Tax=Paracoccus halophilus TaxID=376733 RepID=A0A099EZ29_9RHOB|nr:hypothetical protein [Paracoccus halophilus]KGJ03172.1 hypothetical protein IT41_15205 [Paracoccus halophilus]SFA59210.1 hypothetical protein SAMN04487972_12339 [Paracoccus halophilus]